MTINVTNFVPPPGVTLATGARLKFDVTFSPSTDDPHFISLRFGNSSDELAFDSVGFPEPYAASSRVAISGGYQYTIRRNGHWSAPPVVSVRGLDAELPPVLVDVSVLASPLVIAGNRRVVADASVLTADGKLVLCNAGSGHERDGTLIIEIPAGIVTASGDGALVRPDDWNVDGWDTFDPAKGYSAFVMCTDDTPNAETFRSSGATEKVRDATTPAIVSAIVETGDSDKLIVTFSARVWLPGNSLTGLSLTVNVGAACTLTAIVSGNGTTVVTFDLSRDVVDGDDIDLVIGSARTLQNLNKNKIAAVTFPIDLSEFSVYTPPNALHIWDPRGADLHTSGSNVTQLNDSVATAHLISSTTKPTTTTINSLQALTIIASSYLKAVLGSSLNLSGGFAIGGVVAFPTNMATYEWIMVLSRASNILLNGISVYWYPTYTLTGQLIDSGGGGIITTEPSTGNIGNTTQHAWLLTGDSTEAKLYLDDVLVGSHSGALTPEAIIQIVVGIQSDLSSSPATGMKFGYGFLANAKYTGSTITGLFDFFQSIWATP